MNELNFQSIRGNFFYDYIRELEDFYDNQYLTRRFGMPPLGWYLLEET